MSELNKFILTDNISDFDSSTISIDVCDFKNISRDYNNQVKLMQEIGYIMPQNLHDKVYSSLESTNTNLTEFNINSNLITACQLINDAVIFVNLEHQVLFLNSVAEKLTGWELKEAYYQPILNVFCLTCELTKDNIRILFNDSSLQDFNNFENQIVLTSLNNQTYVIEYSTAPIHDSEGQVSGAIIIFRDITDQSRLAKALSWQMSHDILTGLFNRNAFERYLDEAISCTNLNSHQNVLCHLDLDHFKVINETCGHVAGDEFLRQISAILQKRVRKTDVLARLGGDEFSLILYRCTREQAIQALQSIREDVEGFSFEFNANKFNISISIGAVLFNGDNHSSSHLLNAAISACNSAKKSGRNRIHVYHDNDLYLSNQRGEVSWIHRIFKALENDKFCLYGQSIVTLNNGSPNNLTDFTEILIRLIDENSRLVPPGEFIPPAEKYGLMHLIDRWVILTLFRKITSQDIKENFISKQSKNHFFSINLSGATLNDDQFLDFIQEQFAIFDVAPNKICFEITETVAITNLNKTIELINRLRSFGCYFALDDFGSGMSSFGYLKHLPIDFLKIDGIFIRDINSDNVGQEIVESINRIAHVIGIRTVAEYVESNEVLMKLRSLGVDFAQGFGVAKPSPLFDVNCS